MLYKKYLFNATSAPSIVYNITFFTKIRQQDNTVAAPTSGFVYHVCVCVHLLLYACVSLLQNNTDRCGLMSLFFNVIVQNGRYFSLSLSICFEYFKTGKTKSDGRIDQ